MIEGLLTNPWLIAGPVLLACFGAYLVYRNNRLNRLAAAAAEFRNEFASELAALRNPVADMTLPELLINAFPRHSAAVEKFRHHLSRLRRRQFETAWRRYHSGHGFDADAFEIPKQDQLFVEYYAFVPGEPDMAIQLALERINQLLSFARQP